MSRSARTRRKWWMTYAAGVALTLIALVVVTRIIINAERSASVARAEAARHETFRLALWRLDSWLSPIIAMEAARPYFEFEPFYSPSRAYPYATNTISSKDERWPSPLLAFESEYIALHFQVDESGMITSPQVPEESGIAPGFYASIPQSEIDRRTTLLKEIRHWVGPEDLAREIIEVEACFANILGETFEEPEGSDAPPPPGPPPSGRYRAMMPAAAGQTDEASGQSGVDEKGSSSASQPMRLSEHLDSLDYRKRAILPNQAQTGSSDQFSNVQRDEGEAAGGGLAQTFAMDDDEVQVGPLVPLWLCVGDWDDLQAGTAEPVLTFVRRVNIRGRTIHQGFVLRWWNVTNAMLEEIADLMPGSSIEPLWEGFGLEDPPDLSLATMPATLTIPEGVSAAPRISTGTILSVVIAWTTVLLAIGGVGFALHGGISFGEKRSRFASAVTHELRTPLTTFRMYSEMLAQRMVPKEQVGQYLDTLDRESQRLETLVNNVLAYARLEEGRYHLDRSQRCSLGAIIVRIESRLRDRCADADMQLRVDWNIDQEREVMTDPEVIGQILFNLVENACKYGRGEGARQVDLNVAADRTGASAQAVDFIVSDFGPGIDETIRSSLFQPFERGNGHPAMPGIGLGLALSRGLARDLGGDLTYEGATRTSAKADDEDGRLHTFPGDAVGAVFRLRVPMRAV